ncbi:hypothetical protein [Thalassospira australica]|uniref:hypothetical protein n=1 Tax=Thalassospira australica TaxID=1528106 RepID=UPI00051A1C1A|nr:hypothetical protein [Thalassospira australica]
MSQIQYWAGSHGAVSSESKTCYDKNLELTLNYPNYIANLNDVFTYFTSTLSIKNINPDGCSLANINIEMTLTNNSTQWEAYLSDTHQRIPIKTFERHSLSPGATFSFFEFHWAMRSKNGAPMEAPDTYQFNFAPSYKLVGPKAVVQFSGTANCT